METESQTLLMEIASSVRLLLRHAITEPQGGGAPSAELFTQIRRLDKAMGKPNGKTKKFRSEKTIPIEPKQEAVEKPPEKEKPLHRSKPGEPMLVLRDGKWCMKR